MEKLGQFINKYKVQIILVLILLLGMKSCQSCNREGKLSKNDKKYEHIIDSLKNISKEYKDSLKEYKVKVETYKEHAAYSEKKTEDLQNLIKNVKNITTIRVYAPEEKKNK